MTNTLHYGDNLHVLREHVRDESIDLMKSANAGIRASRDS